MPQASWTGPGMILSLAVEHGGETRQAPATVLAADANTVTVDYNHPLAGKDSIYIEDWEHLSFAGRGCAGCKTQCMKMTLEDAKAKGYVPSVKIRTTDDQLSISLARDNLAAAFVTRVAAADNLSDNLKILDFGDRDIWCHMYLIYGNERPLSHSAILIRQFLIAWCAEHCKKKEGFF